MCFLPLLLAAIAIGECRSRYGCLLYPRAECRNTMRGSHQWVLPDGSDVTYLCDGRMFQITITKFECEFLKVMDWLNWYSRMPMEVVSQIHAMPFSLFHCFTPSNIIACFMAKCQYPFRDVECKLCHDWPQFPCINGRVWIRRGAPVTEICEGRY